MFTRVLVLAGGIGGAAALSQFPEFSQQYAQRLGGAVDELRLFVQDFDADAASVGLEREAALVQLADGGALGVARAETMRGTIARYQRLETAQDKLKGASALGRAINVMHFNDADIAEAAWADFRPAVPLTAEGAVFGGGGFAMGGLLMAVLIGGLRRLYGRRKRAKGAA